MRILSFLIALSVAAFVIIYPRAIASDMTSRIRTLAGSSPFRNELLLCLRSRLQSQKSILGLLIFSVGRMDLCRSGEFHDFFQAPVT